MSTQRREIIVPTSTNHGEIGCLGLSLFGNLGTITSLG
jgi:hypothetical protein